MNEIMAWGVGESVAALMMAGWIPLCQFIFKFKLVQLRTLWIFMLLQGITLTVIGVVVK